MTQNTRLRLAILAALAIALFALVGCTGGSATSASKPSGKPAEKPDVATTATLEIAQPLEGATVPAGDLKVDSTVTNLKWTMPSNKNVAGEGHIHYTLDDLPFVMSITSDTVIKDVKPGEHTLEAELVQNNTQPFNPPVRKEITFIAE